MDRTVLKQRQPKRPLHGPVMPPFGNGREPHIFLPGGLVPFRRASAAGAAGFIKNTLGDDDFCHEKIIIQYYFGIDNKDI